MFKYINKAIYISIPGYEIYYFGFFFKETTENYILFMTKWKL